MRVQRLLAAFGLLNVAEWSFFTALSVLAFDREAALGVGLLGLRFLAAAVGATILAPLVEHRRWVVTSTAAARAVLLAATALMAALGVSLWALLGVVVVDAIVGSCYRPAQQRLIPSLVRMPRELMRAVGAFSIAKTVGQAVGGTAAGLALTCCSPAVAMAGGAALMSVAALVSITPGAARSSHLIEGASSLLHGIQAVPEVFGDRLIWPLVVAGVLRTFVRGVWTALAVVVALQLLHAGGSAVGLFQAAAGVGALLAILVTATQVGRPRIAPLCMVAFAAAGLTIAVLAVVPGYAVALVAICAWGLAMAVADSTSMALLHRALDPRSLFRTVGVMETMKSVSEGAGALLAPALVALLGLRPALLCASAPMPLLMLLSARRTLAVDAHAAGRGRLVAHLHSVTLFSGLDLASIEDLASRLRQVVTGAGENLVTQGEPGDRFYVIESGEAAVLIDEFPIGQLGPGRWFGERALLRAGPRTATVRAIVTTTTQALDRADFLQAMTGLELAEPERPELVFGRDPTTVPVVELLSALTPLSTVDGQAIERLAASGRRVEFEPGATVFTVGDPSSEMYVVLSGRAMVFGVEGNTESTLHPGDLLGEIGVLHATARTRTVITEDRLVTLSLPAEEVRRAIGGPIGATGAESPAPALQ